MGKVRQQVSKECVAVAVRGDRVMAAVIRKDADRYVLGRRFRGSMGEAALGELGNGGGRLPTACVLAVGASDLLVRVLELPAAPVDQQRQMIGHRLEAELPLPLSQVRWDFAPPCRRQAAAASNDVDRVLVLAARSDRLERLCNLLQAGGLAVQRATCEAAALLALHRTCGLPVDGASALLHLDDGRARLALIQHDALCYTRDLVAHVDSSDLADQIKQTIDYAEKQLGLERSRHLFVYAPPGQAASLAAEMAARGIAADAATAAGRVLDEAGRPLADDDLCEWALVIGAGIAWHDPPACPITFISAKAGPQGPLPRFVARYDRPARWAVAAGVLFVLTLLTGWLTGRSQRSRMIAALENGDRIAAEAARLTTQADIMRKTGDYRIPVGDIVTELARLAPDDVLLGRVKISRKDRLTLAGTAQSAGGGDSVQKFIEALQKSEMFDSVRPDNRTTDQGRPKFDISLRVKAIRPMESRKGGVADATDRSR